MKTKFAIGHFVFLLALHFSATGANAGIIQSSAFVNQVGGQAIYFNMTVGLNDLTFTQLMTNVIFENFNSPEDNPFNIELYQVIGGWSGFEAEYSVLSTTLISNGVGEGGNFLDFRSPYQTTIDLTPFTLLAGTTYGFALSISDGLLQSGTGNLTVGNPDELTLTTTATSNSIFTSNLNEIFSDRVWDGGFVFEIANSGNGSSDSTTIPEPNSILVFLLGLLAIAFRKSNIKAELTV